MISEKEVQYRKNLQVLNEFVERIEKRNGMADIYEMLNELIDIYYLFYPTNGKNTIDKHTASKQIYLMYKALKEIDY